MFTELINQVRSKVIFSYAYIQLEFFLQPAESTPAGHYKEFRFKALHFSKMDVPSIFNTLLIKWAACWATIGQDNGSSE